HQNCEQNSRRQGDSEASSVSCRKDTYTVSANAKVSRMAERSETRIAENDVKAHCKNRVDQRLGQQWEQERGDKRGWGNGEQEKDKGHQGVFVKVGESHHARP